MDGVVRPPSEFSMTFGVDPSMIATQELVVPRSIPITFDMNISTSQLRQAVRAPQAPVKFSESLKLH
jgi:hypothetical protein